MRGSCCTISCWSASPASVSRVGGIPGLRLPPLRQLQLLEEDRLQLLGRVDGELLAGQPVDLALHLVRFACPAPRTARPGARRSSCDAAPFHLRQHADQRHLHVAEERHQRRTPPAPRAAASPAGAAVAPVRPAASASASASPARQSAVRSGTSRCSVQVIQRQVGQRDAGRSGRSGRRRAACRSAVPRSAMSCAAQPQRQRLQVVADRRSARGISSSGASARRRSRACASPAPARRTGCPAPAAAPSSGTYTCRSCRRRRPARPAGRAAGPAPRHRHDGALADLAQRRARAARSSAGVSHQSRRPHRRGLVRRRPSRDLCDSSAVQQAAEIQAAEQLQQLRPGPTAGGGSTPR